MEARILPFRFILAQRRLLFMKRLYGAANSCVKAFLRCEHYLKSSWDADRQLLGARLGSGSWPCRMVVCVPAGWRTFLVMWSQATCLPLLLLIFFMHVCVVYHMWLCILCLLVEIKTDWLIVKCSKGLTRIALYFLKLFIVTHVPRHVDASCSITLPNTTRVALFGNCFLWKWTRRVT
jgi:hypothetical protein